MSTTANINIARNIFIRLFLPRGFAMKNYIVVLLFLIKKKCATTSCGGYGGPIFIHLDGGGARRANREGGGELRFLSVSPSREFTS